MLNEVTSGLTRYISANESYTMTKSCDLIKLYDVYTFDS